MYETHAELAGRLGGDIVALIMRHQQVSIAIVLLFAAACGGPMQYEMRGTQLSPGADAHVVAKIDPDRNVTKLEIQSKNLTPPDRLLEGGTTYLVWVRRGSDVPWNRLGALELEDEGRAGSAQLTVAEAAFDLLVSAEKGVAVAAPSGKSIFEQRIQEE